MNIAKGSILGPYEIKGSIGAGGMGEVYKANDTRLGRTVAVKVLPEHLSNDPALRERFEREARAVSSLNHPNICTLHDIGEHDGVHYLVMEHIEGETLADRLKKGALPLEQALDYGAQIADALDKAHSAGIVHRDLKPGNIMLTKKGVKLLDFGLAKTREEPMAPTGDSEQPTQNKPLTDAGTILGTVQYMAPEQLEGKEVDARADLFSLGAVLYEMLTGRKAFEGSSQASLISAIMSTEPPPVSELRPLSLPLLDRIVKRCLAKDPEVRWQTARDLSEELKWVGKGEVAAPPVLQAKRATYALPAAIALIAAIALALWVTRVPRPQAPSYRLSIDLPGDQALNLLGPNLALSPDGSKLVYSAASDDTFRLWLRRLDDFDAVPIEGTEGADSPFFSPDGAWVGYQIDGSIRKTHLERGTSQTICTLPTSNPIAMWDTDDYIYFSPQATSGLMRVSANGGEPEWLTEPERTDFEIGHGAPSLLPDGSSVLFTVLRGAGGRAAVLSLETGEWRRLDELGAMRRARYFPAGYLVYVDDANALAALPFDIESLRATGPSTVLVEDILMLGNTSGQFSLSENGALAYAHSGGTDSGLTWLSPTGALTKFVPGVAPHARFSPDGMRVAVDFRNSEATDIWILDERGTETRLTTDGTSEFPVWSSDGKWIVFVTGSRLEARRADGVGENVSIWSNDTFVRPTSWSRDGRFLALEVQGDSRDIWILPLDILGGIANIRVAGEPQHLHETAFDEGGAVFSPDGRWLAYASTKSGRHEVYIESFPDRDHRHTVSTQGGQAPSWSGDGGTLYYRNGELLLRVAVQTEPTLSTDVPEPMFRVNYSAVTTHAHYDVTRDGQQFVSRWWGIPETRQRIRVVTNLLDDLTRSTEED